MGLACSDRTQVCVGGGVMRTWSWDGCLLDWCSRHLQLTACCCAAAALAAGANISLSLCVCVCLCGWQPPAPYDPPPRPYPPLSPCVCARLCGCQQARRWRVLLRPGVLPTLPGAPTMPPMPPWLLVMNGWRRLLGCLGAHSSGRRQRWRGSRCVRAGGGEKRGGSARARQQRQQRWERIQVQPAVWVV